MNVYFLKRMFGVKQKTKRGFSLIETLVAAAVFALISVSIYKGYIVMIQGMQVVRSKLIATNIANEQFEIIRNLPYVDVGIIGSIPDGKIQSQKIVTRNGSDFIVDTIIRNIDDPFDGTIGGSPEDTSPADNKLVEVTVSCIVCKIDPISFTSRIAPRNLESTENSGALRIQAFDANGLPVQGANVTVINNLENPAILINDVTDIWGVLQIVDLPEGVNSYEITVTKPGYSSDQTYSYGNVLNPTPYKPHANVATGQITQVSFSIDLLSELNIVTHKSDCSNVPNVDLSINGLKTIGFNVFKFNEDIVTNGSGDYSFNEIEWDTYNATVNDASYYLSGSNPTHPLQLNAGTSQLLELVLEESNPNAILIQVMDSGTGLPITDADVAVSNGTVNLNKLTSRGAIDQSDWSGGFGQTQYLNTSKYFSDNGNIEANNPSSQITLANFSGSYLQDGILESSTIDMSTTTNFHTLDWEPQVQPPSAGVDSVLFQVATSASSSPETWNFLGPDGTIGSYYNVSGQPINSIHDGDRYARYKVFLHTDSVSVTPNITNVSFQFSTGCIPTGEVLFDGLSTGDYSVNVSRTGYDNYVDNNVEILEGWQQYTVFLNKQ